MKRKAVIGIDGSPYSYRALDYFMDLAEPEKWEILLLHVVDQVFLSTFVEAELAPIAEIEAKLKSIALKNLEKAYEKCLSRGYTAYKEVRIGRPHEDIIKTALEKKANLIVIGSRGLRGLERMLLGSVSSYIATNSPIPVLIVPGVEG